MRREIISIARSLGRSRRRGRRGAETAGRAARDGCAQARAGLVLLAARNISQRL
eukprot:COSAG03_NODE_14255_length_471_cov_0.696237_1_plen_53_part_10